MPHSEPEDAGIPVIDISDASAATAQKVLAAAATHGFLFIKNDGVTIPCQDIDDMFDLSKQFFQQPQSVKEEFPIKNNRGWVRMQGESLDPQGQKQGDPKEAFNIAEPRPSLQALPPLLDAKSALISRFQTNCHALCTRILTLLGTGLQIPDQNYFSDRHDQSKGPSGTIFRMLYYPATKSNGDGEISHRAGAHSDYGSITLLFRLPGQPGLEILTESGSWASVPVNPSPSTLSSPPILVNIGDLLCYWTNGMLKSTVHRVAFSGGEERYSMAYFCHPLDDAKLEAVESKVIKEFGDKGKEELESQRRRLGLSGEGEGDEEGKALTAGEHLWRRLKVTYGL